MSKTAEEYLKTKVIKFESINETLEFTVYSLTKVMEEYTSIKLAEKEKEIESLKEQIVNTNEFILEVAKYEKETTSTRLRLWAKSYIKKYTNINIESLNK